jgi:hypothetical protein
VIDTNTNLSRYHILFSNEANAWGELKQYGDVHTLSPSIAILKMAPGKTVTHEELAAIYFEMPIPASLPTPALREEIGIIKGKKVSVTNANRPIEQKKPNPFLPIGLIIAIIGVCGIGLAVILKKRSHALPDQPTI